jgi:4-hydroxy-4-methyl-2-oxoglutarate aldolase
MPAAPALVIRRRFPRPPAEILERFAGALVGNVCDAQGARGGLDHRIRPLTARRRFVGPALAVQAGPRDNLAPWAALEVAEPGDVLVVATGFFTGTSVCGDILVGMARNRGVRAIVTDGLIRDQAGIDATGVAVFAAGVSPLAPLKNGPGEIGLGVVIGGVSIESGDIVIGDDDGVAVVPRPSALAVLEALERVRKKEADSEREVAEGKSVPSWMAAILAEKGARYIE